METTVGWQQLFLIVVQVTQGSKGCGHFIWFIKKKGKENIEFSSHDNSGSILLSAFKKTTQFFIYQICMRRIIAKKENSFLMQ